MSAKGLTKRQREVLGYLARCEHSTRNVMRRVFDTSPTTTLRSLEARGLVKSELSSSILSNNVRWTITDAGKAAAGEAAS